jgi:putative flippase GtrA
MLIEKLAHSEFARFLVAGLANTSLTYLLYLSINLLVQYTIAYTISYCIGIVFSYWLNSYWVFHQRWSWCKLLQYPAIYIVQYIAGLIILYIIVKFFYLSEWIAPLIVIILTVPLTFVLSRFLLKSNKF